MATKRSKAEEPEEELISPSQVYEEFEIDEFLTELDDISAQIYIWRIDPKNGEKEFIAKIGLDAVRGGMHEYLRDAYGPGKFRLTLRSAGSGKYLKAATVRIADMRVNPSGNVSGVSNGLEQMFQRNHEMMLALIGGLAAKPAQPLPDIGNLLAGLAAMTPKQDMGQLLTGVVAAITALKPSVEADPTRVVKDTMAMLSSAKELFGGGNEELSTLGVVKDLGSKVIEAFQPALTTGAGTAARALPMVADGGPEATPQNGGQPVTVKDWIVAQLNFLKRKAAAGKDVDDWIDYILDNREEPGCASICTAIEQGVTFEQVLQFDPEIAQNPAYVSWFKKLFDGLREELLSSPVDTMGAAGDGNNPGRDAIPIPGSTPIPTDSKPS